MKIPEHDLKISSEPCRQQGGQHVGDYPMYIIIEHIPTGFLARTTARSQHKARSAALLMIELGLIELGWIYPEIPEA